MAENCKVYTPKDYVNELLDAAGYNTQVFGKRILENSCGVGGILCIIIERYIIASEAEGYEKDEIKKGLERDICGVEIDPDSVKKCKANMSRIAEKYAISDVKWNIIQGDYLKHEFDDLFDLIVGNPPYIVYRDIRNCDQEFIREKYATCQKGKFNYYYAFVEKSVNDLADNGILAYIVPSSLYKNEGALLVRNLIKPYITKIIDYTHSRKFPGIVTSSTVLVLEKCSSTSFLYNDMNRKTSVSIQKTDLRPKWSFSDNKCNSGKYIFGDYFNVHNSVATLRNKAFVLDYYTIDDDYYYIGTIKIEKDIVRPAISRKKGKRALETAVIFPYHYKDGNLLHYSEQELQDTYPYAFSYLSNFREDLDKRATDKKAQWFEYGRSQALTKINADKLVLPSIESKRIDATIVDKDTIPLAGFFITAKSSEHSIIEAKRILESEEFYKYIENCGVFTTGYSRRISVKDILEYRFDEWVR